MKIITSFFTIFLLIFFNITAATSIEERPDILVKRISQEVLEAIKLEKNIQATNINNIISLIQKKILPYVDINRMTALAVGYYWREATLEQKKQLSTQFRQLLVYTYAGAISQINDYKIKYRPLNINLNDTDVEVNSQIIQSPGKSIQLNYRLEKQIDGWKMYDINIMGIWLVEAYKDIFKNEIIKSNIDGLIKTLTNKNKQLTEHLLYTTQRN